MKKTSTEALVHALLNQLQPRQREVLEARYGVRQGHELTLAEVGARYGVTRERVRQIESLALQSLKGKLAVKGLDVFLATVTNYLRQCGGVRREDLLVRDLRGYATDGAHKNFPYRVKFLLDVTGTAMLRHADKDWHPLWYVRGEDLTAAQAHVQSLVDSLGAGKEWHALARGAHAENYISLSKKFATNSYGEFGLAEWAHIHPKTARDWAYLVLRKATKPMHFTDLAKSINTLRRGKVTNVQTVHNELIKDKRFVLVGRGIYGLQEFNLLAGTCREVIRQILKKHGPQTTKDTLKLVLAHRDFKENTLMLNLQNKKHFMRLGDGRYTVREV